MWEPTGDVRVDGFIRTASFLSFVLIGSAAIVTMFLLSQRNLMLFVSSVVAVLTTAIVAYTVSFLVMSDRMTFRGYQWGIGTGLASTIVGIGSLMVIYTNRGRFRSSGSSGSSGNGGDGGQK